MRYPFSTILLPDFGQPLLKHADVRARVVGRVYTPRVVLFGSVVVAIVFGVVLETTGRATVVGVAVELSVDAEVVVELFTREGAMVVVATLVSTTEVLSTTGSCWAESASDWLLVADEVHPYRSAIESPSEPSSNNRLFIRVQFRFVLI